MSIEAHVRHRSGGKRAPRSVDGLIAAWAEREHGVVTGAQLVADAVGRRAIDRRIAAGLLRPLHRGVFAVGHPALRPEAWWMAAVLAAGRGAALSHRSAGAFWRIRNDGRARVEVSVPKHRRSTARLEVHAIDLAADEVTVEEGIRVTTPARTLFDLAAVVSPDQLEHAFNETEYRRLTSPGLPRCHPRAIPGPTRNPGNQTSPGQPPKERRDADAKRPRAPVPYGPRCLWSPATANQSPERSRRTRRPLARAAPRRRVRRLRRPRHPQGLRGRPRPRPHAGRGRLARGPHHVASAGGGRRDHRRPAPCAAGRDVHVAGDAQASTAAIHGSHSPS